MKNILNDATRVRVHKLRTNNIVAHAVLINDKALRTTTSPRRRDNIYNRC